MARRRHGRQGVVMARRRTGHRLGPPWTALPQRPEGRRRDRARRDCAGCDCARPAVAPDYRRGAVVNAGGAVAGLATRGRRALAGRMWPRIFGLGLALWLASVVVTMLTGNANLIPTLILLGSFLVPISFVAWALETWRDEYVTTELVVSAFVVGGL